MSHAHTHIPIAVPSNPAPALRLTTTVRAPSPDPQAPRSPSPQAQSTPTSPQAQPESPSPQASTPPSPHAHLERLLTLYLDPNLTIADIAFTLSKSILETLRLINETDFLNLLAAYELAHDFRAKHLARCGVETAARTLTRIAERCEKPETARKAAGAIVRMHKDNQPRQNPPDIQLKAATTLIDLSQRAAERFADGKKRRSASALHRRARSDQMEAIAESLRNPADS